MAKCRHCKCRTSGKVFARLVLSVRDMEPERLDIGTVASLLAIAMGRGSAVGATVQQRRQAIDLIAAWGKWAIGQSYAKRRAIYREWLETKEAEHKEREACCGRR